MTATGDTREMRVGRATPGIKAARDRPEIKAEMVMPRHAQQGNIATRTPIPAEKVASETKDRSGDFRGKIQAPKLISSTVHLPGRPPLQAPLQIEQGTREFALLSPCLHYRREDGNLHSEGGDGPVLRFIRRVDNEVAGEIRVELSDAHG